MKSKIDRIEDILNTPFADVLLKPREREVVHLVARGIPANELPSIVGVKKQGVYRYLTSACVKIANHREQEIAFKDLPMLLIEDIQKVLYS